MKKDKKKDKDKKKKGKLSKEERFRKHKEKLDKRGIAVGGVLFGIGGKDGDK